MTTNPHRYAILTVLQLVDLAVIALSFTLAVVTSSARALGQRPRAAHHGRQRSSLVGFLGYCHLIMRTLGSPLAPADVVARPSGATWAGSCWWRITLFAVGA
jgi:hypothetical protein